MLPFNEVMANCNLHLKNVTLVYMLLALDSTENSLRYNSSICLNGHGIAIIKINIILEARIFHESSKITINYVKYPFYEKKAANFCINYNTLGLITVIFQNLTKMKHHVQLYA